MRAQVAMHDRMRLAFDAAGRAGLPGRFDAFDHAGLLVTLTTAPGLDFLNVVAGVTTDTLGGLPEVLTTYRTTGAPPPSLLTLDDIDDTVAAALRGHGYEPGGERPIAVLELAAVADTGPAEGLEVRRTDDLPLFLDVLGAGYDASPAVRDFMAAEHSADDVTRFVATRDGRPVAAAAMSVHRGVAVLGGAAVLPAERGHGHQRQLLHHRLRAARAAGCVAAASTAAPQSPSLANLRRAGFEIHVRWQWRPVQPVTSAD